MEREELEKLEQDLDNIRAWIQKYTGWLKSERDPAERAKHKRRLKFLQLLERRAKDKISRHHLANRIKQWKEELSSPAIDSAPRVPGYSSRRQFVEEMWRAGMERLPFLDAKILQNEFEFPQWIVEYDGWEVLDETSKKPVAESVQMGNRVPRSTPSQKKKRNRKPTRKPARPQVKQSASGSPPVNNAATEPEAVIETVAKPVGRPKKRKRKSASARVEEPIFTYSDDYLNITFYGKPSTQTEKQRTLIRVLHEAHKRGQPVVHEKTLLQAIDSTTEVRSYFRRSPLWGNLVVRGPRKGTFRLNLPLPPVSKSRPSR